MRGLELLVRVKVLVSCLKAVILLIRLLESWATWVHGDDIIDLVCIVWRPPALWVVSPSNASIQLLLPLKVRLANRWCPLGRDSCQTHHLPRARLRRNYFPKVGHCLVKALIRLQHQVRWRIFVYYRVVLRLGLLSIWRLLLSIWWLLLSVWWLRLHVNGDFIVINLSFSRRFWHSGCKWRHRRGSFYFMLNCGRVTEFTMMCPEHFSLVLDSLCNVMYLPVGV